MPTKRTPPDDEISELANRFRELWRPGDVIRPWLRKHRGMVIELVHDDWSWAAIANAITRAGITYRTGRPWTAEWLRRDFFRAKAPLKRGSRQSIKLASGQPKIEDVREAAASNSPADVQYSSHWDGSSERGAEEEPEFKLARFIDWDEKRGIGIGLPDGSPKPAPAPSQRYTDVIEHLTGKKPLS